MLTVNIPESLNTRNQIIERDISFVDYCESSPVGRNLISFGQCAISFILSGEKELFRESESTLVRAGQGIVIPQGNAIIAERRLNTAGYCSLVIFFPSSMVTEFTSLFTEAQPDLNCDAKSPVNNGFLTFEVTPYLNLYIQNMLALIRQRAKLTYPVMLHKLQELFLTLLEMHPTAFKSLWKTTPGQSELRLRAIIENNIAKGFTLNELAFLANRSLASFKRDFEKAYGTSPGKYMLKRKMEIACHSLKNGKSTTEAALETGYESPSHFAATFKKLVGCTPKAYQTAHLLFEPQTT